MVLPVIRMSLVWLQVKSVRGNLIWIEKKMTGTQVKETAVPTKQANQLKQEEVKHAAAVRSEHSTNEELKEKVHLSGTYQQKKPKKLKNMLMFLFIILSCGVVLVTCGALAKFVQLQILTGGSTWSNSKKQWVLRLWQKRMNVVHQRNLLQTRYVRCYFIKE